MNEVRYDAPPQLQRIQLVALVIGIVGLIAALLGAFLAPQVFFRSYLVGYLFWVGIALGCLGVMLLHHTSGGAWGAAILRFLEAGASTLPLMALLFLPLILGLGNIYPWARPELVAADPVLQHKSPYLNAPFFVLRTVVYFAAWLALTYFLTRWSSRQDRLRDPALSQRMQALGTGGLILFVLTTTFAAFDWIMSLEPHWFSSIYGLMVMMGQVVGGFALVTAIAALFARRYGLGNLLPPRRFNDLGTLLFSFVMLWAYLAFSQFLLIWFGNLPEEVPWYLNRLQGGWQTVALLVVLFHFILPFILLLSSDLKRRAGLLAVVALMLVAVRFVETYWLVGPASAAVPFTFSWLDLAVPLGIGGLWLALFLYRLRSRPLVPLYDPRLWVPEAAVEHEPAP